MRTGEFAQIPLNDRTPTNVDLQAIRNYLEGTTPEEKTASNK